jgi:hypothetical protein
MCKMSLARILGKGIWQQGAQLRTVSVHMLAMVQMEWRALHSAYRVLTEFACRASIWFDP